MHGKGGLSELFVHSWKDSIFSPGIKSEHPKTVLGMKFLTGYDILGFYWRSPWETLQGHYFCPHRWGSFTVGTCCLSREAGSAYFIHESGARNWVSMCSPVCSLPFVLEVTLSTENRHSTLSLWVSHRDRSPHVSPVGAQHGPGLVT